jgi:uncharacterized membrane protein YedE/YeeE
MIDVLAALALGFLFGWALNRAGLTQSARIVNVFRFKDLTVMRFMLTALAVGGVLIQLGAEVGWATSLPIPPTFLVANLVGGLIFGVGMASAGYCPGTIVAESAEGRLDAWVGGFSGLFVGALLFGVLQPTIMPVLTKLGALGRISLAGLLDANPWLVLLFVVEFVVLVLLLLAQRPTRAAI